MSSAQLKTFKLILPSSLTPPRCESFTSFPFLRFPVTKVYFVALNQQGLDLFKRITLSLGWHQPVCCVFCRGMRNKMSSKKKAQRNNWKFHCLRNGKLCWKAWRGLRFLKIIQAKTDISRKICVLEWQLLIWPCLYRLMSCVTAVLMLLNTSPFSLPGLQHPCERRAAL